MGIKFHFDLWRTTQLLAFQSNSEDFANEAIDLKGLDQISHCWTVDSILSLSLLAGKGVG